MTDFAVFWWIPIILFFFTWFFGSLSVAIKESEYKWLWPLPILAVILFHVFNYYNHQNLSSLVWGSRPHMGYYQALLMFGNAWHQWFNWILLGADGFYCVLMAVICLFNIDVKQK